MKKKLIVILGAGASYDCVGPNTPCRGEWKPPLVTELFSNRGTFADVQGKYPLAASAASEVRAFTKGSESIENFLRQQYKDSEVSEDKKAFSEIPLYMQHLLLNVSNYYTALPDNYNILCSVLARLEEVIYITLNYDVILDTRLSHSFELSNMDSYINDTKKWALIKLHGSVNWGYELDVPHGAIESDFFRGAFAKLYGSLDLGSKKIIFRGGNDLISIRFKPTPGKLYFPALSVPVGSSDELTCPPEHIMFLKKKLQEIKEIDILVIGYSGYDKEVVNLLVNEAVSIKSLKVVNGSLETARSTIQTFSEKLKFLPNDEMIYNNTFNNFVQDGSLQKFISS